MALKQIAKYYARWSLDNHNGAIYLWDAGGTSLGSLTIDNPEEFRVAVDLLRNEEPVYLGTTTNQIRTGWGASAEPVGDGEG